MLKRVCHLLFVLLVIASLVYCAMAVHNPLAFTPADAAPLRPPGDWHGGHWSQGLSKTKTFSALLTRPRTRRRSRSTLRDHQKLVTTVQSMPPHGTPSKTPWTSLSAMQRHARQLKITAAKQRDASELQLLREQVQHLQEQVQHSQSELDTAKPKMKNMFAEEQVLQQFSDIKREFVTLSDVEALHEQIKTLKQEIASSTVHETDCSMSSTNTRVNWQHGWTNALKDAKVLFSTWQTCRRATMASLLVSMTSR